MLANTLPAESPAPDNILLLWYLGDFRFLDQGVVEEALTDGKRTDDLCNILAIDVHEDLGVVVHIGAFL